MICMTSPSPSRSLLLSPCSSSFFPFSYTIIPLRLIGCISCLSPFVSLTFLHLHILLLFTSLLFFCTPLIYFLHRFVINVVILIIGEIKDYPPIHDYKGAIATSVLVGAVLGQLSFGIVADKVIFSSLSPFTPSPSFDPFSLPSPEPPTY